MTRFGHALLAGAALAAAAFSGPVRAEVLLNAPTGSFGLKVMSWRDIPFRTVVRQQYDYSCGSAAVATLLKHHLGQDVGEADVFEAMFAAGDQKKIQREGFSLLDMKRFLEARGFTANGYRAPLDKLVQTGAPAIVMIQSGSYRHFVVVKGLRNGQVLVGDPAQGLKTYSRPEFEKMWNGVLFVATGPKPALFNASLDWNPWSTAPLGTALPDTSLSAFTREFQPLHQVTTTFRLDPFLQ